MTAQQSNVTEGARMRYMLILGIGDGSQHCIERRTLAEIKEYINRNYATVWENYQYYYLIEFNVLAHDGIHTLKNIEVLYNDNTSNDPSV